MRRSLLPVVASATLIAPAGAATIAATDLDGANSRFSSSDNNLAFPLAGLSTGNIPDQVGFYEFDLSSLTPAEVNAPGFEAFVSTRVGFWRDSVPLTIGIYESLTPQDTPSWNNSIPAGPTPWSGGSNWTAADTGAQYDTITVTASTGYTFDVTPWVQGVVNGSVANNGLTIVAIPGLNDGQLRQANFANTATLETQVVPEPTSTLFLLFAGMGAASFTRKRTRTPH